MCCLACERVRQARDGENPHVVAENRNSLVVLADDQRYVAYCIVLFKHHKAHMHELSHREQNALFQDVLRVGGAIWAAFTPERINYECLCNRVRHVHWHVIPRYAWDPEPESPIWLRPKDERNTGVGRAQLSRLVKRLQAQLTDFSSKEALDG